MSTQFSATILMQRPWPLNIGEIAEQIRSRYPQIGQVDPAPGQAENHEAGLLTIDGATVVVMSIHAPVSEKQLKPPLKTLRIWDPEDAVRKHYAQVTVSCGGDLPGVDGAKAYAAAVHFVTAAIVEMSPATAVFWPEGWSLTQPADFIEAAATILQGRVPLGVWTSFANIVPRGYAAADAMGIVSYGMRPFIGRELELAPAPVEGKAAYRQISAIARSILEMGVVLTDGHQLVDPDRSFSMIVRERDYWLRADLPAFVLVGEDSVVDAATLGPVRREAVA